MPWRGSRLHRENTLRDFAHMAVDRLATRKRIALLVLVLVVCGGVVA